MMQQQLATEQLRPLPDSLSSAQAKLVYLYLEATGGATIDDINETLAMKKIDVLSVLRSLSNDGLVESVDDRYVTAT